MKATIMLESNKRTAKNLLEKSIYYDKKDGLSLLLVLVFYMGIDDGGKQIIQRVENN